MPLCKNPECGRRFVSEGTPGCPYCCAQWLATLRRSKQLKKPHIYKQAGKWRVIDTGYPTAAPYGTPKWPKNTYPLAYAAAYAAAGCQVEAWNTHNA